MGFSRQEYWSGLPCPLPGDLPHPGIKSASLMSPALEGWFFTPCTTWEDPILPAEYSYYWGFPGGSASKESTCNEGDSGSIPGSGRPAREGIGYTLQISSGFLVAQLVKNLPAMWETWVGSLGWDNPLEKGKAIHSRFLAWRIPWTVQTMGLQSQTQLSNLHFTSLHSYYLHKARYTLKSAYNRT